MVIFVILDLMFNERGIFMKNKKKVIIISIVVIVVLILAYFGIKLAIDYYWNNTVGNAIEDLWAEEQ